MAPNRTVLFAHPSADLYGSDRVLLESLTAMIAHGWRVDVALPETGPLVAEIEARGGHVLICPAPVLRRTALRPAGLAKLLGQTIASVRPAWRLLRGASYSVVFVNTVTIPTWLMVARLRRLLVVCHVHEAEKSKPLAIRFAMSLPLLTAHRVIVNSEFNLTVLASSLPVIRRRVQVIYNGIPGPLTVTAPRPDLVPPIRLLFIGRLSPRKGPQVAIAALVELLAAGVQVRLDLLGAVFGGYEWFEESLRRQVAETGVTRYVRFLGFDSDVWPHIAAADIVVVPSTAEESFGNTAVEAMLAARPLVVSSASGLLEAAEGYHSVRFVEPDAQTWSRLPSARPPVSGPQPAVGQSATQTSHASATPPNAFTPRWRRS